MAFRQSSCAPQRQTLLPDTQHEPQTIPFANQQKELEDSQEWILFPPHPAHSSSPTHTSSTHRTTRSAGISRLSDFGSLDTAAGFDEHGEDGSDGVDDAIRDDEDLDSLDDGLHAFQEASIYQSLQLLDQSRSILPMHDGLGTFHTTNLMVQEQLWNFEHHNPRKMSVAQHRRTSSVQRHLEAVEESDAAWIENERVRRIEEWRMEQSKVLLNMIEKETRSRKSFSSSSTHFKPDSSALENRQAMSDFGHSFNTNHQSKRSVRDSENQETENSESLWERIARRVIRDILGIDDTLLSIIFGESFHAKSFLPKTPPIQFPPGPGFSSNSFASASDSSWDTRLLDRLACELGVLAQYLTKHPGAFSTPFHATKPDYTEIPISTPRSIYLQPFASIPIPPGASITATSSSPRFNPTLQEHLPWPTTPTSDTTHAALWGIEEEPLPLPTLLQERERWERTPDVRTIFRLLHHHFSKPTAPSPSTPTIATTATPASLRRAAVIRQHHPLVSRASARKNRNTMLPPHHYHHQNSAFLVFKRSESSCKSLSVRMGNRGGSGSSGNYWDLGCSGARSGNVVVAGGLGAWGDV